MCPYKLPQQFPAFIKLEAEAEHMGYQSITNWWHTKVRTELVEVLWQLIRGEISSMSYDSRTLMTLFSWDSTPKEEFWQDVYYIFEEGEFSRYSKYHIV